MTALVVGSIAADVGLGAMAYKGVKDLKQILETFNIRLTKLEDRDTIKIGFRPHKEK